MSLPSALHAEWAEPYETNPMPRIHAALSFNPDAGLIQAGLPLFQGEEVDALEWSFDTLFLSSSLGHPFSDSKCL